MVIFENFFMGYDNQSKKIVRYDVFDSFENAERFAERYIKTFFPNDRYIVESDKSGNELSFTMTSIGKNLAGQIDQEFIRIYYPVAKTYSDVNKIFDDIEKRQKERLKSIFREEDYTFEVVITND